VQVNYYVAKRNIHNIVRFMKKTTYQRAVTLTDEKVEENPCQNSVCGGWGERVNYQPEGAAQNLLHQYAMRLEALLEEADDPEEVMKEMVEQFEIIGLNPVGIRTETPSLFVRDLITENPLAPDWFNLQAETMSSPLKAQSVEELIDRLPPPR